MGRPAPLSRTDRTLLACRWCDFGVGSLERDERGRLVSGYALLQRHIEACPRAGAPRGMGPGAEPDRVWLWISEVRP